MSSLVLCQHQQVGGRQAGTTVLVSQGETTAQGSQHPPPARLCRESPACRGPIPTGQAIPTPTCHFRSPFLTVSLCLVGEPRATTLTFLWFFCFSQEARAEESPRIHCDRSQCFLPANVSSPRTPAACTFPTRLPSICAGDSRS